MVPLSPFRLRLDAAKLNTKGNKQVMKSRLKEWYGAPANQRADAQTFIGRCSDHDTAFRAALAMLRFFVPLKPVGAEKRVPDCVVCGLCGADV
jgi:hypothetical protein